MNVKPLFLLPVAAMLLSACLGNPQTVSGSAYAPNEMMRAMPVNTCTVQSVRIVDINAMPANPRGGRTVNALTGPNAQAGAALGAIAGTMLAGAISDSRDARAIGALVGVMAGTTMGEQRDRQMGTNRGVEYVVTLHHHHFHNTQQRLVVQPIGANDTILRVGSGCRLAGSGNMTRVLPM